MMTEAEYQTALARICTLARTDPAGVSAAGRELDELVAQVEEFERARYPLSCCALSSKASVERALRLLASLTEFYDAQQSFVWFYAQQPLLDGQRPIDMIITEDGSAQLDAAVERLRASAHV